MMEVREFSVYVMHHGNEPPIITNKMWEWLNGLIFSHRAMIISEINVDFEVLQSQDSSQLVIRKVGEGNVMNLNCSNVDDVDAPDSIHGPVKRVVRWV